MLLIEPGAGIRPVVQLIRTAQRSVSIEVYLLTNQRILSAIRNDTARGIRVRILLDAKPWRMTKKVPEELAAARAAGASVRLSPPRFDRPYVFDHAKTLIIDSGREYLIGTANFSWPAFHQNREYLWIGQNPAIGHALIQVFDADWHGGFMRHQIPQRLVLSPNDSLGKISRLLTRAGPIDVEEEEFGKVFRIGRILKSHVGPVRILVPATIDRHDRLVLLHLRQTNPQIRIRILDLPYLHAKMIWTRALAFVGSQNLTWSSLRHNREVGILIDRPAAIKRLQFQFEQDWGQGTPL